MFLLLVYVYKLFYIPKFLSGFPKHLLWELFLYYHKNVEGYDAKYSNISIDDCANFCKTTENCYGFGYDMKNKVIFSTKNNIILLVRVFLLIMIKSSFSQDLSNGSIDFILQPDNGYTQFAIYVEDISGEYIATVYITDFILTIIS